MKKIVAFLLSSVLIFTGCVSPTVASEPSNKSTNNTLQESLDEVETENSEEEITQNDLIDNVTQTDNAEKELDFNGLDDPELLSYVENAVYENTINELDSNDYFVEQVKTIYLSQEYLEESAYNSQSNIFFGYTLEELEEQFQGKRYVFTLGEDGQTEVRELEEIYDDTYDKVIKNVATGSGVILVCVTVSLVTANMAPAVSMIFAASATTGTIFALQSGYLGFASASLTRAYQTQDFDEAIKAGMLAASEGFKWGAVIGAITGGTEEGLFLAGARQSGLNLNDAAVIQRESKWPLEAIKSIHSKEEYEIYKKANLIPTKMEDGSLAFLREVDWTLVDSAGRTNVERVAEWNLAPIDSTGKSYELHHLGQRADGPLAILTNAEHHAKGNVNILNYAEEGKDITDAAWRVQKEAFWKAVLKMAQGI